MFFFVTLYNKLFIYFNLDLTKSHLLHFSEFGCDDFHPNHQKNPARIIKSQLIYHSSL